MLENKVARLESIVEILKSAPCTPKAPLRQRLYAAEQLYGKYNVHVICDAFDIPRGTFYNHVLRNKKDNTWHAKRREELRLRIQEIFDESNQVFGAAKIAAVMKSEGFKVSNEMVRTLMRDMGLVSIRQSAKKLYEDEGRKYKNLLSRGFTSYQYITRELVDYFKQTCDLEVSAPTTSGKADLTISGNWFDGSFGAVANVLQLQYCYKENNSDYGDWITVIPDSSTYNKYEYSTTLTGLNYKSKYTFKARAIDKINTVISELQVRRTEPIFDWGVDSNGNADFNINGALKINGNSIDYIVEEGTNGIWTYRKWNSGIAECWGTTSPKTLTLNTAWGNLYTNNTSLINNAISYPFSFTATPAVVASTIFNNTSYWAVMANSGGVSSSPKYKAVMPQSGSATCSLHFRVIGKWK